jgi:hypothetical protein
MKLTEAIKNILYDIIPNTINGIHSKCILREVPSLRYHDTKDYILILAPVEIKHENVAVSLRIYPDTFSLDFDEASLSYYYLSKDIERVLLTYIRNIKKVHNSDKHFDV